MQIAIIGSGNVGKALAGGRRLRCARHPSDATRRRDHGADRCGMQAGAGIVADSDPMYEQRECEAKSGALFAAAREAVARASEPRFGQ